MFSHRHDSHTDTDVCVEHMANDESAKRRILRVARQFRLAAHHRCALFTLSHKLCAVYGVQVVSKNKHERRKAAEEAEVLLVEERLSFEAWRDSLETVPTIKVRPELQRSYTRACDGKLARWQISKDGLPAVGITILPLLVDAEGGSTRMLAVLMRLNRRCVELIMDQTREVQSVDLHASAEPETACGSVQALRGMAKSTCETENDNALPSLVHFP